MIDYNAIGYDPDGAPSLILICTKCGAEIPFYGDPENSLDNGDYTLDECDKVGCNCGATYGEGESLGVLREDA